MTEPHAPPAETKGGAVPYLSIDGAMKAVEFYKAAFGAEVAMVMPPDEKGRTMHAHLHINGSSVMLSDFFRNTASVPCRIRASTCCCP